MTAESDSDWDMGVESSESSESDDSLQDESDWHVEELHPHSCTQSRADRRRMYRKLQSDPYALNRPQELESRDLPLHVAIYCNHLKCVQLLLEEGASVDRANYEGLLPLDRAVQGLVHARHECAGITALRFAALVRLLLQHGSSVNYGGPLYFSTHLLEILMDVDDFSMAELLLDYGADTEDLTAIRTSHFYYNTPLLMAFKVRQDVAWVRLIFTHGAILNLHRLPGCEGYFEECTPVPHALLNASPDDALPLLRLYREMGGDMQVRQKGLTALECLLAAAPDAQQPVLLEALREMSSAPLPLTSLARLAVRRAMGREFRTNIKQLPLPRALKKFLKFKENS